jgi:hypothetical protein
MTTELDPKGCDACRDDGDADDTGKQTEALTPRALDLRIEVHQPGWRIFCLETLVFRSKLTIQAWLKVNHL